MMVDDNEWNQWRGHTQAILETMNDNMKETNTRLKTIEKELWIVKAKAAAFGTIAAALVSALIAIFSKIRFG